MTMKKACPKCAIDVGGASVKLRHHLEKAEPLYEALLKAIENSKPAMKEAGMAQMEYGPALALIHEARAAYGKVLSAHLHLAQALVGHQRVLGGVDGDAVQPSVEAGISLEMVEVLVDLDEGFLSDVQGFLFVAEHAERDRIDPPLVALDQQLEGALVSAADAFDEGQIIGGQGSTDLTSRKRAWRTNPPMRAEPSVPQSGVPLGCLARAGGRTPSALAAAGT